MSLMNFRESNQVKWVGVRPAHNGEQVLRIINSPSSTNLYTVPSGKKLFLTDFSLGVIRNTDGYAQLQVKDTSGNTVTILAYVNSYTGGDSNVLGISLFYPIEIPSGYGIYLDCTLSAKGYYHGWLE